MQGKKSPDGPPHTLRLLNYTLIMKTDNDGVRAKTKCKQGNTLLCSTTQEVLVRKASGYICTFGEGQEEILQAHTSS